MKHIYGIKVLLYIRDDKKGVIFMNWDGPEETVTGERYSYPYRLSQEFKKKAPFLGKGSHLVVLLLDNARPHVAKVTQKIITKIGWEVLPHPAYLLDLAPTDYHLFRLLQHYLSGS